MCAEMLPENRVVRFADLPMLCRETCAVRGQCGGDIQFEMDITTNLRSLVNTKRRTANIRRKGSSESLMLQHVSINRADKTWLSLRSKHIRSIEVVPELQVGYRLKQRSRKRKPPVFNVFFQHQKRNMGTFRFTNIAAISLTPRHFLTSWTIILILPPSPVSPESGTEMGGPGAPSSSWTESWVASDMMDEQQG